MVDDQIGTWTRNSFRVEAAQVTPKNAGKVAAWCEGDAGRSLSERSDVYVLVNVVRYKRLKKQKAWQGDWIVKRDGTFMVYSDAAFKLTFHKPSTNKRDQLYNLVLRALLVNVDSVQIPSSDLAGNYTNEIMKIFEGD